MAAKQLLVDLSLVDFNHVVADLEAIRQVNPQRFEMEQLTAVVYEDLAQNVVVGYKDVSREEFWIRGHMPNMPLMPGVIMLEAAAQLSSFYVQKHKLLEGAAMVGFGGLENVRFRDPVIPGDRLILIVKLVKARRRILVCQFQGVVRGSVVVEGELKGIAIPVEAVAKLNEERTAKS